ncbi:alpha/beta hydrolase family protein [Roseobacter sp.]|uniref:alpha/beta hydrolase family protein n=1 Tax=Roseobacter sp. TaxID=1907202 RepID=UPI00296714D5|nr:alpha/beta hydrolase [Roseobacter sp.]MDW3183871.1 alpha/beta hydrolase [Roseobacter sp.]
MSQRLFVCLYLLLLSSSLAAQTRDYDGVPLPEGLLSKATHEGDFVGAWSGLRGHRLKHILVVENIQPDGSASAIYAYGDMISWGLNRDWQRYPARIEGDSLVVTGNGFAATYLKLPSGVLMANYQAGRAFSQAVLHPLDLGVDRPKWTAAVFEKVKTELSEQNQPVAFEVVIFKPNSEGPFPLAIVNHGSTGDGKNPSVAKLTFVDSAIAQYLIDRGYLVAFPQRRGRGKSDGLYDEGFSQNRSTGYSCATETSLEGAERAIVDLDHVIDAMTKRPDVQSGPVLLSGVSRGGILSMAYAGRNPNRVAGVINLVGGWMSDNCPNGEEINDSLFSQAASFPGKTLSLYGENDPFYSTKHTEDRFATFKSNGGQGAYVVFDVPGGNGHALSAAYALWAPVVDVYLDELSQH